MSAPTVTPTYLKSTGTPGIKIQTAADEDIVKFWDNKTSQFYVAWSSGNASYRYLDAGTDALVIRGPNEIAANFLGSAAGAEEGKALFY